MAETQHAVRLPNQLPQREHRPEQCRAFCGTVENSPVVQPRVNVVRKSSPASSRTAELPSRRKSNPVVPQTTRDWNTKCANPEFHSRAIVNRAAKSAALLCGWHD